MGRFIAGDIFPDLRRKWGKALLYMVLSILTLFAVVGLLEVFVPYLLI